MADDPLGLSQAVRIFSDAYMSAERLVVRGGRYEPEAIQADVEAGHCIDLRERYGGRFQIRSRARGGTSPWQWLHHDCARYLPDGKTPATYWGGAPDWPTAWAYLKRHAYAFHGIELGEAGWHVGYPTTES